MHTLNFAVALFLLLNLGAGMWRVVRGPTAPDRMLAAQWFGTTAVAAVAFVRRAWPDQEPGHHHAE